MSQLRIITSDDPILDRLDFKPFLDNKERRVTSFQPAPGDPQTRQIETPWGVRLVARKGDFLISEVDTPEDYWPVAPSIFEESYAVSRPGFCIKTAVTLLVPLTDITGDPDHEVTIETPEGSTTVRSGDFYLAKGIKGEIWPYPKKKVDHP